MQEIVCGVDKPVRDRMKGLVNGIKDFIDQDTFRNFSHLFGVKTGKVMLVVCTLMLSDAQNPVTENFIAELFNHTEELCRTDKTVALDVLKKYLAEETAKGVRKEDVMNHFWEIDNKLVEDTLFWEQTGLDLTKIQ